MILVSCHRSVHQALNLKLNPISYIKNQLKMIIHFNVKYKIIIPEENMDDLLFLCKIAVFPL